MASQDASPGSESTPESTPFVFEIHTYHNVLPPGDEEEHGKVRLSPDILQFIVDQDEVSNVGLGIEF